MIIKALREGLIEHEASDTGGVPRWQSSCPDRLAEATVYTSYIYVYGDRTKLYLVRASYIHIYGDFLLRRVYLISSRFSGACVFHVFLYLYWSVVRGNYWVGKVPAAVFRAHNRPKTALFSWSFAARWHAFPFLMLFAIGCVFL